MTETLDHVSSFVVRSVHDYGELFQSKPLFVALNGVQGAGKTTLVTALAQKLRSPPLSLSTVVVSIDDFYLPHEAQLQLAKRYSNNPLVQHRGQPSTHDVELWRDVFEQLSKFKPTRIPQYDKSRFDGQGDRVDLTEWEAVNESEVDKVKVVIFEGWCVGFRSLPDSVLQSMWEHACRQRKDDGSKYRGRLGWNRLEDIRHVNRALAEYESLNSYFDVLIHLDAEDMYYVYDWRLEQEAALRKAKGSGMAEEQVHRFVDGYYSSYELYTEPLRKGALKFDRGSGFGPRQLRVVIDRNRKVIKTVEI